MFVLNPLWYQSNVFPGGITNIRIHGSSNPYNRGGLQKSAGSRWESQSFDVKSLKHSENVRCFKINENA